MRCAALNTGLEYHSLDHIAPLAELMGMSLIVTEEQNELLARRYYPQVEVRYLPDLEFKLSTLAQEFDALFECKYWASHLPQLFQQLYGKEMRLVFCPHGQSDKGFKAPLLAPYALQDTVLLYGDLLIQMLKELSVWPSIPPYAVIGNYRLSFYQKYRAFYDGLVEREFPLDKRKRTLLYAPTWRDADGATSFFQYGARVLSELPADWNLIVKLHPFLEQRDPARFYPIARLAEERANIWLIQEFPPVYPLLAIADVYLGDASSVGYDFLSLERPLYFFPTETPGRLHACGSIIDPSKNLYLQLEQSNAYQTTQRSLSHFAFGSPRTEEQVRAEIYGALTRRTATCS